MPRCHGAAISKYKVGIVAAKTLKDTLLRVRPGAGDKLMTSSDGSVTDAVPWSAVQIVEAATVTLPHSGGGTTGTSGSDVNISLPPGAIPREYAGQAAHFAIMCCNSAGWSGWSAHSGATTLDGALLRPSIHRTGTFPD